MGKIGLIIAREYLSRVKKRSFIIMTILGPVLIVGFIVSAVVLGKSDFSEKKVLVTDESGFFKDKIDHDKDSHFTYTEKVMSPEEFKKSEWDMHIYINRDIADHPDVILRYKQQPDAEWTASLITNINKVYERYLVKKYNTISYDDYINIKKGINLKRVNANSEDEKKEQKAAVGLIFSLLIYLFIFLYGSQVMRGVIEEKTSRVIEVLVSSVTPFQLMMGKIIGIMLVGLTQFVLWVGLIFMMMMWAQSYMFNDIYGAANVTTATGVMAQAGPMANVSGLYEFIFHEINYAALIGVFIFFFVGGYLLYGALFAAVGSAVDSEADTQQFIFPISIPLIFGFIISEMALQNPDGKALAYASHVPLTSPVAMMVRVATGSVPFWEVVVSMLLLVIAFVFTTWVAAKIYRVGILMYGKKPTYKELWKWMRYKG
jgi:ABC-2 type transport system permease protein